MKTAYSLLIDEYVDVNLVEPADCDALRIACPICQQHMVVRNDAGQPVFQHEFPPELGNECESQAHDLSASFRNLHNGRARRCRREFLGRTKFTELLGEDPLVHYKTDVMEVLSDLQFKGALSWLPDWHWQFVSDLGHSRLQDPVESAALAESYLRQTGRELPDVPESGYRRRVHIQVAFDVMQYLLTPEGRRDNYRWLFLHAYMICLRKWAAVSGLAPGDQVDQESLTPDEREHQAAARILTTCTIDLMSPDEKVVENALDTLSEIETGPPIMAERIPLRTFVGAEIAGEMQYALYRLPYLPMLGRYVHPCRPCLD